MSETQSIKPRFIAGSATPIGPDRDPHPQPEPLLPPDVKIVERSIEISDYTKDGVNEAIEQRYWPCVDALVREGAKSINLAGFPIASQLGLSWAMRTIRPEICRITVDGRDARRQLKSTSQYSAVGAGAIACPSKRLLRDRGALYVQRPWVFSPAIPAQHR